MDRNKNSNGRQPQRFPIAGAETHAGGAAERFDLAASYGYMDLELF
jgi:hypothetical protein